MNDSDEIMVHYLLGQLPESEASALEQEYFAEARLFERLVEVENQLVDQYARGQLSPQLRERFETHYLAHPERRERAHFARALTDRLDQVHQTLRSTAEKESWWGRFRTALLGPKLVWGFALVVVLFAAGGLWFVMQTRQLHQELARNAAERARQEQRERDLQQQIAGERARADQLASELDRLRAEQTTPGPGPTPRKASALATLILTIGGIRSGATGPPARLVIEPGTEQARFQLNLSDNDYQSYSIVVQSAGGKQLFKRDGLETKAKRGARLVVIVPAKAFSNGDYIVTLKGTTPNGEIEDVSKSLFHVEKK